MRAGSSRRSTWRHRGNSGLAAGAAAGPAAQLLAAPDQQALARPDRLLVVLGEPRVGPGKPLLDSRSGPPAEPVQAAHVEELARHAIGLRGVEDELRRGVDDPARE